MKKLLMIFWLIFGIAIATNANTVEAKAKAMTKGQVAKKAAACAEKVFFAETNCRLLQNAMYVGCCIKALGATPPNPCKINGWGKSKPTFTPSVDSAITYKKGLQLSAFYFCNKHRKSIQNKEKY